MNSAHDVTDQSVVGSGIDVLSAAIEALAVDSIAVTATIVPAGCRNEFCFERLRVGR